MWQIRAKFDELLLPLSIRISSKIGGITTKKLTHHTFGDTPVQIITASQLNINLAISFDVLFNASPCALLFLTLKMASRT